MRASPPGWCATGLCFVFLLSSAAHGQAPASVQLFMPDGAMPARELRLNLTTDAGRVDTFFTDSKGRFVISRSQGLRPDAGYTITVESDGRTFDTTTISF